jgi:hypothetical protein
MAKQAMRAKVLLVLLLSLVFYTTPMVVLGFHSQEAKIDIHYDSDRDQTTIKLLPLRIAENNVRYHSLDLSAFYIYRSSTRQRPVKVDVEIVSVVKARRLNSDLYVVFVIDGREVHFSSNRSAIPKPVPGRLWVGERMVFSVPEKDFQKLASAKSLAIKLGPAKFVFTDEMLTSIRVFADSVKRTFDTL